MAGKFLKLSAQLEITFFGVKFENQCNETQDVCHKIKVQTHIMHTCIHLCVFDWVCLFNGQLFFIFFTSSLIPTNRKQIFIQGNFKFNHGELLLHNETDSNQTVICQQQQKLMDRVIKFDLKKLNFQLFVAENSHGRDPNFVKLCFIHASKEEGKDEMYI